VNNLGELTEKIMLELEKRNVKSLKQVRQVLEKIEEQVEGDIVNSFLDTIIDSIEKDKDLLTLYISLRNMKDDLRKK